MNPTHPASNTSWPGASGIYKYSKAAIKINVWTLILVYLLFLVVIEVVSQLIFHSMKHQPGLATFLNLVFQIATGALSSGALVSILLASTEGRHLSVGQALDKGRSYWLSMLGLLVLTELAVAVSFVALIIPVFFVAPRLILGPYFLVDQHMGAVAALKASWAQTKGNAGKVWGVLAFTVLLILPVITIIGIPFTVYFVIMYSAATALLYRHIIGKPLPAETLPAAPQYQTAAPSEAAKLA